MRISDWSSDVCSSDLGQYDTAYGRIGIATYRRLQERACEGQVDGVSGLGTIESQRRCGAINREKNRCIAHQQALLGHRRRIALARPVERRVRKEGVRAGVPRWSTYR